ncbi:hypothetical protein J437_LFUL011862, partial [Ladona fulva]
MSATKELLLQLLERVEVNNAVWNTVKNGNFFQVTFSVEAGDKCEECIKYLNECGFGVRPKTSVRHFILISQGPILAGTFGIVVHDKQLKKIGVINELIGLAVCILVGFIYGLVIGCSSDTYRYSDSTMWPTSEMISRGQIATLWVGCLIALPSGAGVALGILGGNVSSLVGVAISASLLPPAVNAVSRRKETANGKLIDDPKIWNWEKFMASVRARLTVAEVVGSVRANAELTFDFVMLLIVAGMVAAMGLVENSSVSVVASMLISPLMGLFWALAAVKAVISYEEDVSSTEFIYFAEKHRDYATLGAVSLCLTIINIICIFIAGVLVLKVKEVAPQTNNEELRQFWQHDIRVARDYNRTLQGQNASDLGRQLLKKLSVSRNFMEEAKHEIGGFSTPRHVSESGPVPHHKESVVSMNSSNNQFSWTSGNMHQRYMFHPRFHQKSNSGPSEEELERVVYSTLTADSKRGLLSGLGIIGVTGQSSKRKISSMSLPGNSHHLRSPKISTCVEPQLDTIREASTNLT